MSLCDCAHQFWFSRQAASFLYVEKGEIFDAQGFGPSSKTVTTKISEKALDCLHDTYMWTHVGKVSRDCFVLHNNLNSYGYSVAGFGVYADGNLSAVRFNIVEGVRPANNGGFLYLWKDSNWAPIGEWT